MQVDVFRDLKKEGEEGRGGPGAAGLSQLFKPPEGLLFKGDFEMAKMRAGQVSGCDACVDVCACMHGDPAAQGRI